MDSASSSTSGAQNRQKRVLPSRSRRGGPGVGTCEVDVLILETLKRRCMCRKTYYKKKITSLSHTLQRKMNH